ncbi:MULTISPECIES: flagellar basal-body MS-ring/collar protein FliF [Phyllobacteriaceae]|uniref:Flagellar M-ring protein n=1 Tax=Mesorhizobium hungaricum TaxID=1566387 RepID=A0A1C2EA62_9HYPH|nr:MULTISPECIES: flagellar basal-body MS-ring/collar protein FliF [Mesorhizobium]MBN9237146.1 flagellar M-ring protein FliF [Mesorhizobium sp.]MDQ0329350.1 flagellar M-ring protein FliF [Mesorhizobium sp. YL-MeA3-2017]OCX23892.1 flagellar M-ring protein FliF [Mesorhizobium hungaricum]
MPEQLRSIVINLQDFGTKRLAIMAGIALLTLAVIGIASVYLNRPSYETLYVGLERSDVNQIGMVLAEAGMNFDVGSDGASVLVPVGTTAKARMLLAEKGLPTSANAGYELFDKVGSLGLTSFMQQVTRVRALEGEIARTIQSLAGVKAARVHIVMSERANFRREEQQPSASVVIRYAGVDGGKAAMSIRHLVAAAVPGLSAEKVTVLDSAGNLLAAGDDPSNTSAARSLGVERTVESQIEDNIRRALTPYLGPDNFRASVKADVNTDTRQTEETIFDPESRVERSVQTVKANENSNQRQAATPTTVEQNLPETQAAATDGPQSSSQNDRKEEITNYEINSKKIATVSNGYSVTKMSIAVVVNQQRLMSVLGKDAKPEQIAQRVADIKKMVASATGLDEKRGDIIDVSAVEFIDGLDGQQLASPGILDAVSRYTGSLINAAAFIVVVFLVAFFGLRPMAAALSNKPAALAGPSFDDVQRSLPTPDATATEAPVGSLADNRPTPLDDLRKKLRPAPQDRLARMVDINEERTANILRKWTAQEAAG